MKRESSESPLTVSKKRQRLQDSYNEFMHLNETYYKHPINCQKANKFNNGSRKKPIEILRALNSRQEKKCEVQTVIHWFRSDLRLQDNLALSEALKNFKKYKSARFLSIYVINEHDWRAHLDGGWKLSFILNALKTLGERLSELSIPLHVLRFNSTTPELSNSNNFAAWLKDECLKVAGRSVPILVTANLQYESDELYRDVKVFEQCDSSFMFRVYDDDCVVNPGTLVTGKQTQYTLFTPWYKKWIAQVQKDLKKSDFLKKEPEDPVSGKVIDFKFPHYELPSEFLDYVPEGCLELPKASEDAAFDRLSQILEARKLEKEEKHYLQGNDSSDLGCYITCGLISTRAIIKESVKYSNGAVAADDLRENTLIQHFIREVAWRDFHKHAFCNWPFLSMDLPYYFELNDMRWKNDEQAFINWCRGETGVPIVDAVMRKLQHTGVISNQARLIAASFLCKNLLIDYRWGERWFRKHLIDFDLISNVAAWGFISSTGIDSQPYFRIYNMELQSKKFDPEGQYIRKWVPELKDCKDVHTFHLKRKGYRPAIVDYKKSRESALEAYREVL